MSSLVGQTNTVNIVASCPSIPLIMQQGYFQGQWADSSQDTNNCQYVRTVPQLPRTCASKKQSPADWQLSLHQVQKSGYR